MTINFLVSVLQLQIIQIILIAHVGALLGEMKKEIDDEELIRFDKFVISWLSSGFGGVMVGLLLQGTFAKGNNYVVLGGSGIAGFAGQQKSIGFAIKILNALLINGEGPPDQKTESSKKKPSNNEDDQI